MTPSLPTRNKAATFSYQTVWDVQVRLIGCLRASRIAFARVTITMPRVPQARGWEAVLVASRCSRYHRIENLS